MRIIAGQFRSRRLKSVPGTAVRPTPDRLRESLFSVLSARIEGSVFVDAYAGSGTVGLEALSRGARRVVFIERNPEALIVLRTNVQSLGVDSDTAIVRGRAALLLADHPADLVFLDPPYDQVDEYRGSLTVLAAAKCPYVIAQHSSRLALDETYGALQKTRILKQGDNSLSFYALSLPPAGCGDP